MNVRTMPVSKQIRDTLLKCRKQRPPISRYFLKVTTALESFLYSPDGLKVLQLLTVLHLIHQNIPSILFGKDSTV